MVDRRGLLQRGPSTTDEPAQDKVRIQRRGSRRNLMADDDDETAPSSSPDSNSESGGREKFQIKRRGSRRNLMIDDEEEDAGPAKVEVKIVKSTGRMQMKKRGSRRNLMALDESDHETVSSVRRPAPKAMGRRSSRRNLMIDTDSWDGASQKEKDADASGRSSRSSTGKALGRRASRRNLMAGVDDDDQQKVRKEMDVSKSGRRDSNGSKSTNRRSHDDDEDKKGRKDIDASRSGKRDSNGSKSMSRRSSRRNIMLEEESPRADDESKVSRGVERNRSGRRGSNGQRLPVARRSSNEREPVSRRSSNEREPMGRRRSNERELVSGRSSNEREPTGRRGSNERESVSRTGSNGHKPLSRRSSRRNIMMNEDPPAMDDELQKSRSNRRSENSSRRSSPRTADTEETELKRSTHGSQIKRRGSRRNIMICDDDEPDSAPTSGEEGRSSREKQPMKRRSSQRKLMVDDDEVGSSKGRSDNRGKDLSRSSHAADSSGVKSRIQRRGSRRNLMIDEDNQPKKQTSIRGMDIDKADHIQRLSARFNDSKGEVNQVKHEKPVIQRRGSRRNLMIDAEEEQPSVEQVPTTLQSRPTLAKHSGSSRDEEDEEFSKVLEAASKIGESERFSSDVTARRLDIASDVKTGESRTSSNSDKVTRQRTVNLDPSSPSRSPEQSASRRDPLSNTARSKSFDDCELKPRRRVASENSENDAVEAEQDITDPPPRIKPRKNVRFKEDLNAKNNIATTYLESEGELSPEEKVDGWFHGRHFKAFKVLCHEEVLNARKNEDYCEHFRKVHAACSSSAVDFAWKEIMAADHKKDSPNSAVLLAKARSRGFERDIFPEILVRARTKGVKSVVKAFKASLISITMSPDEKAEALREASEKMSQPFRRFSRLLAQGDSLLVTAWDRVAVKSAEDDNDFFSGGSCRSLMGGGGGGSSRSLMAGSQRNLMAGSRRNLFAGSRSNGQSNSPSRTGSSRNLMDDSCRNLLSKQGSSRNLVGDSCRNLMSQQGSSRNLMKDSCRNLSRGQDAIASGTGNKPSGLSRRDLFAMSKKNALGRDDDSEAEEDLFGDNDTPTSSPGLDRRNMLTSSRR